VTIAVPFPAVLTDAGVEALGEIAAAFPAWQVELAETAWFRAPHEVLWLTPEPAQPYHELAAAIAEVFELEVYGGPGVFTPHVTVGVGAAADLAAVEEAVQALLPLRARAAELQLVQLHGSLARAARSWPFGS
jgi:2'-5' RNA ligase